MIASFVSWATDWVETVGPAALAVLMLVETVFPPIPSELVLPFAGFLIGQGELHPITTLVAATAGSVTGALAIYAASRAGGRPLVERFGRHVKLTTKDLDRADRWFDDHGSVAVFVARMIPGVRSLVSVPAGTTNMPIVRFTLLTAAGSMIWNAGMLGAGYLLGDNWDRIETFVGPISLVVGGSIVAVVVVFIVRRRRSS